ncbi:MAG: segregation/condensation protein A [Bacillota bacterium]|nr:segregation/condensation protein A [Bacillota bacterium]
MYKVKLDIFEGPFDLLVYLIEKARMSIFDIQVSEITTQYLAYIEELKAQDVSVAQEFMVLAAELIELKSKMLLPIEVEEAEAGNAEDPRAGLVQKILEYKQFKEIAHFLQEEEEVASHVHSKPQEDINAYRGEEDILLKGDMQQFIDAFTLFISKKKRMEEVRKRYERIERQRVSIEERIAQIRNFFKTKVKVLFSELITNDKTRFNKVATFIGLLELLKQGEIKASQEEKFGDITVELRENNG